MNVIKRKKINVIMLFSSPLVLRLLKMRFGLFKRPSCLIIRVCRHKCDFDRRLMIFLTSLLFRVVLEGH